MNRYGRGLKPATTFWDNVVPVSNVVPVPNVVAGFSPRLMAIHG